MSDVKICWFYMLLSSLLRGDSAGAFMKTIKLFVCCSQLLNMFPQIFNSGNKDQKVWHFKRKWSFL